MSTDPHREALLDKAAALVAPLMLRVALARLREARAETIRGIAFMAVAKAISPSTSGEPT